MKLQQRDITNQRSGVLESKKFTIEMNATAFQTAIDGLYSDKVRAPIRELATNAWDASPNHNFDVHLPSQLDPRFWVRDYGPGMSHEYLMGLYTTLYSSTKRDRNDAVGCLGLGSKSPFAYASQFYVQSFQGGTVMTYCASIEADGVPQFSHLDTKTTTEADGLKVSFNVKIPDIQKFRQAARFTLFGFDAPRPNVVNEKWEWPELTKTYEGKGWCLYEEKDNEEEKVFSGPVVRMGCVIYPLDLDAAGLNHNASWVNDERLFIDIPIGDVDIMNSREGLGYTERTNKYLKDRLNEIRTEIASEFQKKVDACVHIVEAGLLLASVKYTLVDRVSNVRQWKGQDVPYSLSFAFEKTQGKFRVHHFDIMSGGRRRWNRQKRKTLHFEATTHVDYENLTGTNPIFVDLEDEKSSTRILNWDSWDTSDPKKSRGLWVKVSPANLQAFLDFIGNPQSLIYVRDLPMPPRPPRGPRNPNPQYRVMVMTPSDVSHTEISEEESGYFLNREAKDQYFNGKRVDDSFLREIQNHGAGVDQLFCLTETQRKHRYFKKLRPLDKETLRALFGPLDITAIRTWEYEQKSENDLQTFLNSLPGLKFPDDLQEKIDAIVLKKETFSEELSILQFLWHWSLLTESELKENDEIVAKVSKSKRVSIHSLVLKRYPLLDHIYAGRAETKDIQSYIDAMEK